MILTMPADVATERNARAAIWIVLLVAGFALACHDLVDPPLPPGSQRFAPPDLYQGWWAVTEACSGVQGDFSAIQWYSVPPDANLGSTEGGDIDAYWSSPSNRIVVRQTYALQGILIRHEMLHALLKSGGHPRLYFLERCSGTVNCEQQCRLDAGPPPPIPAGTLQVPMDSFDLAVELSADTVHLALDSGYFTLAVAAHNRSNRAVIASLPLSGNFAEAPGYTFGWAITGPGSASRSWNELAWDGEDSVYAAGQTKQFIFDFFGRDPSLQLGAGSFQITGSFGLRPAATRTLTITP
jgi:hypothetical protein